MYTFIFALFAFNLVHINSAHSPIFISPVRDAAHLVWFIIEIACTPCVLGLALTVVLCA